MDEWYFWRVIKKDFSLYAVQEKISFPDLQVLNALLDMDDDMNKAFDQYHKEQMDKIGNKK